MDWSILDNTEITPLQIQDVSKSKGDMFSNSDQCKTSQLTLWQNYCDKKMECEKWKELFETTLDMLVYLNETEIWNKDEEMVETFISEMNKCLQDG